LGAHVVTFPVGQGPQRNTSMAFCQRTGRVKPLSNGSISYTGTVVEAVNSSHRERRGRCSASPRRPRAQDRRGRGHGRSAPRLADGSSARPVAAPLRRTGSRRRPRHGRSPEGRWDLGYATVGIGQRRSRLPLAGTSRRHAPVGHRRQSGSACTALRPRAAPRVRISRAGSRMPGRSPG
jgi:hypothetical protein